MHIFENYIQSGTFYEENVYYRSIKGHHDNNFDYVARGIKSQQELKIKKRVVKVRKRNSAAERIRERTLYFI